MALQKTNPKLTVDCHTCALTQFCLPMGLNETELQQIEAIVNQHHQFARGELLKQQGDKFKNFYAVRTGAVKSAMVNAAGDEQVFGFYLPGEIVGFEAVPTKHYPYALIAMTDTQVCEIPFTALMDMANSRVGLQYQLLTLASQGLTHNNCIHLTSAQQKVAAFLLNISERLNRGVPAKRTFELPMSRQEIGNHLGLAMETVSRVLTQLQTKGLINLQHRKFVLTNTTALKAIAAGQE